jgi:hypothetical protein
MQTRKVLVLGRLQKIGISLLTSGNIFLYHWVSITHSASVGPYVSYSMNPAVSDYHGMMRVLSLFSERR